MDSDPLTSDDHDDSGENADHTTEANGFTVTNILFGNINKHGELEEFANVDEDERRAIGQLGQYHVTEIDETVSNVIEPGARAAEEAVDVAAADPLEEAEDFYDFAEACEDDTEVVDLAAIRVTPVEKKAEDDAEDDYDAPSPAAEAPTDPAADAACMPPPSQLPTILVNRSQTPQSEVRRPGSGGSTEMSVLTTPTTEVASISPKKLNTPLGIIMPEEYADVPIRSLFSGYDPDYTPRWSRLFKPTYPLALYKGPGAPAENPLWNDDRPHLFMDELDLGRIPNEDEILPDETEQFCQPSASSKAGSSDETKNQDGTNKKADGQQQSSHSSPGASRPASWRNGPANLWYDMMGLPEDADVLSFWGVDASGDLETTIKEEHLTNGESTENDDGNAERNWKSIPNPDQLLTVDQVNWEDDLTWDAQACQSKIIASLKANAAYAGWFPTNHYRAMAKFQEYYHGRYPGILPPQLTGTHQERPNASTWRSIFPVENEDLGGKNIMNEVIWSSSCVRSLPPCLLTLDKNDEELILDIPEDSPEGEQTVPGGQQGVPGVGRGQQTPGKGKAGRDKDSSKAKMILGKHGLLKDDEDELEYEEEAEDTNQAPQKKDPLNLSNDEFYYPRLISSMSRSGVGLGPIQHSTPALELRKPFFPTHMGPVRSRQFHRQPLKKYTRGLMSQYDVPHPVLNLTKNIRKKAKQREEERLACGGGEIFFMRTHADLSSNDGELILAEYSEQFPPLMMQVGMATRVVNYYKRPSSKEASGENSAPPHLPYGELCYSHQSPFLGQLRPGQCLQVLENNMFRASMYPHKMSQTDFLIIRNRNNFYIRRVEDIFTIGQEAPNMEVPSPNSKKANNFNNNFLQVSIYRLFWKSDLEPRRIKMEDVRKDFQTHSESSVRKRLKLCSDFKRTGQDASWWVLRPDFRLPTEDELRAMVSPEECCAYYSMMAALQRLTDAGYRGKYLFVPNQGDNDDEEESDVKIEDEVQAAPWHTTQAYLSAMKGKCFLELHGNSDPTGCGEGFSYVKISTKPGSSVLRDGEPGGSNGPWFGGEGSNQGPSAGRRMVTGTDADLRKLHLRDAKAILRKCGVPEHDIKRQKRWEIINLVRELSNAKAKQGEEEGMAKFARGNRLTSAEQTERYKEECQRIFDLQNRVLASEEVLSTDEDSTSGEDDSDCEEVGRNIESFLADKMTSKEMMKRREEDERRKLQRAIQMGESLTQAKKSKRKPIKQESTNVFDIDGGDSTMGGEGGSHRALHITRTFVSEDGKRYTRTEVVRNTAVIGIYLKIRKTKTEKFISEFVGSDELVREEQRREKRRLQDKLRRIKKLQEQRAMRDPDGTKGKSSSSYRRAVASLGSSSSARPKKVKPVTPALSKMRCGACGELGHMRTNKECPMYGNPEAVAERRIPKKSPGIRSAKKTAAFAKRTVSELLAEASGEVEDLPYEDKTQLEGTKLKLSADVMRNYYKSEFKMKIPKKIINDINQHEQDQLLAAKRRKSKARVSVSSRAELQHGDYSTSQKNRGNRRRIDPRVAFNHVLECVYKEIQTHVPGYKSFLHPVKEKDCPNYYQIIDQPMDLSTVRGKIHENAYSDRAQFLKDLQTIHTNSVKYNGGHSEYTEIATNICSRVFQEFASKEHKLGRLESLINPRLHQDKVVGFNAILGEAIEAMEKVEGSFPFRHPVDKKRYKDYYTKIAQPMDLSTMREKRYRSREEFIADVELILKNCITFNGEVAPLSVLARRLVQVAKDKVLEQGEELEKFESIINNHDEELSVTGVDTESITGQSQTATEFASQMGELEPLTDSLAGPSGHMERTRMTDEEMDYDSEEGEGDLTLGAPPPKKLRSIQQEEEKKKLEYDLRLSESEDEAEETVDVMQSRTEILDDLALSEDENDDEERTYMEGPSEMTAANLSASDYEDRTYMEGPSEMTAANLSASDYEDRTYMEGPSEMTAANLSADLRLSPDSDSEAEPAQSVDASKVQFYLGDEDDLSQHF